MKENPLIYLDYNATTPIAPEAVGAMTPFLHQEYGNPSSPYDLGVRAREALEKAREEVALLLGCSGDQIVFTSGGTESNNAVLKGLMDFRSPENFHMITSGVEHPAVLNPALYLMELGARVDILPVDSWGRLDPERVRKAIRPETKLISVMWANNETGVLQPIRELAEVARQYGIPLHTDAAQAIGKIPVPVNNPEVDFLSLAGHKVYAPKGVGALFIKEGRRLTPLIHGAGQEGGRRPGTENVMLAVGLGAACRAAREGLAVHGKHMKEMRDRLEALLFQGIKDLVLNGHTEHRLPNTLSVSVPGLEGGQILEGLPRLMASTGAACHDRRVRLSHVLAAMGVPPEIGMGTLRLTTGRYVTLPQIEEAASMIIQRVKEMRHGA